MSVCDLEAASPQDALLSALAGRPVTTLVVATTRLLTDQHPHILKAALVRVVLTRASSSSSLLREHGRGRDEGDWTSKLPSPPLGLPAQAHPAVTKVVVLSSLSEHAHACQPSNELGVEVRAPAWDWLPCTSREQVCDGRHATHRVASSPAAGESLSRCASARSLVRANVPPRLALPAAGGFPTRLPATKPARCCCAPVRCRYRRTRLTPAPRCLASMPPCWRETSSTGGATAPQRRPAARPPPRRPAAARLTCCPPPPQAGPSRRRSSRWPWRSSTCPCTCACWTSTGSCCRRARPPPRTPGARGARRV